MENFSNILNIKQFQNQQKIRFHTQIRAEKTAALMSAKRHYFIEKSQINININEKMLLLQKAINNDYLGEIYKNLQSINNYIYEGSQIEISHTYKEICKEGKLKILLEIINKYEDNYVLITEIFMLFVNFSALLDDSNDIDNFFENFCKNFIDIFKESNYVNMKNNIFICIGNLMLKDSDIASTIIDKFGFLEIILETIIEQNNSLTDEFFKTSMWFLEIALELKENINVKNISLILKEIVLSSQSMSFELLKLSSKLIQICPENEIFDVFLNLETLFKNLLSIFSKCDPIKSEETYEFIQMLFIISSQIDLTPNLLNMDLNIFLENSLMNNNHECRSKILDVVLNFFCHSSQTIKILLPSLKDALFSLIFGSNDEIMRKSLQSICLCFICGDDEICIGLFSHKLCEKILEQFDNEYDNDHLMLMLKTIEKILFYGGSFEKNNDEQNIYFEDFCCLGGEEKLEKLLSHNSKTISLMALHIIDKYF